jgi:hypothetical protein
MRYLRAVGAFGVAASLAVPAMAWGHGSVYTETARVDTDPGPGYSLQTQTRHLVTNHGFTLLLRETNGASDRGMVDYSSLPGDYRRTIPISQWLTTAEGDTAAQPHATCRGAAALESLDAIQAWQDADPFYNYVPFQTASAGLEDDPARWLAVIEDRTGLDLEQTADIAVACASLGGTYTPADQTQTTASSLASGVVGEATAPLNSQIASLQASLTSAEQARDAAKAALAATNAQLGRVMPGLSPFTVTLPAARMKARTVAAEGAAIAIAAAPLRPVTVSLLTGRAPAKRLGLPSRVLASATGTIGANGTAILALEPEAGVARALRRLKRAAPLRVRAVMGDRSANALGLLTR